MARPIRGSHCRLKARALPTLARVYSNIDAETRWTVEQVDAGYGREALVLSAEGRTIIAWRSQVTGEPRCQYCQAEGHSGSTGTAKTCVARAEQVAAARREQAEKMRAHWAKQKAEAALMKLRGEITEPSTAAEPWDVQP
jgi:hypothetical protein